MLGRTKKLAALATLASVPLIAFACASGGDGARPPDQPDTGTDALDEPRPDVRALEAGAPAVQFDASFNLSDPDPGPAVYYGGPVMLGEPNVYFVWYGDWSEGGTTPQVLASLVTNLSDSPYDAIVSAYYQVDPPTTTVLDAGADAVVGPWGTLPDGNVPDGSKERVTGRVHLAQSAQFGYLPAHTLYPGDVGKVVAQSLRRGLVPYDPSGIYVVLTSGDVGESLNDYQSFCNDYCGWHDSEVVDGVSVRYAMVGDPAQCIGWCTLRDNFAEAGVAASPNDNWSADGMASVLVHELFEILTDPSPLPLDLCAWRSIASGGEIGDMCVWRFDPTYATDAGSRANVRLGDRDFLIQQMWVLNDAGGRCDLRP